MRYRILGPLALWRDDQEIALAPAKWRVLLAVLLCDANQVVTTGRLVAELWGDRPPQSVNKLVQGYISRVRRALGDETGHVLITHAHGYRAHGYRLSVGPGELDAHRFVDLIDRGRQDLTRGSAETAAARLAEALGLWSDAPFADVPPTPAIEAEAARLSECHTQGRELRIEAQLRLGQHKAVLDELEALVAGHPLREGLRGQLMLALYRAARQADALAAYRDLRHHLAGELGIEPGPPLQQLHQQILNADESLLLEPRSSAQPTEITARLSHLVPRELPHTGSAFVGRTTERSVLRRLLDNHDAEQVAIAVIDGSSGVGKSALAVHTAHQLADRFPDGQFYVDLQGATAGMTPLEPVEVLGRFLSTLGAQGVSIPANADEAAATFRSLVAERRLLVVLDNAANVDQVRPLLPGGPNCAVLITSRESLTTLEGATHLHLGVMFHDQAITLLERLVGADRVAAEPEAADTLVRLCGRLPLALRIVAARVGARPNWPLREFVDRLTDAQGRLDEMRVGDLSVRASFHASYDAICHSEHPTDRAAARAFRMFGVAPGPNVSLPAAVSLLDVPAARAEEALERLVDAHLVNSPAPGRYHVHDLLRLFAREQVRTIEPPAERERALERLLRFSLTAAEAAVALLDVPPSQPPRLVHDRGHDERPAPSVRHAAPITSRGEAEAWLDAECPNLLATVAHAVEQTETAARLALRLTQSLQWYLYPRCRVRELRSLNELAIRTARRLGDRASEALGYDHLSSVYWLHSRFDGMRHCLESAIAIWRDIGDREGEQRSLCNLADALVECELYDEAVAVQGRQLALASEAGDHLARLTGLGNLGRAYRGLGRIEDALVCLEESFGHAQQLGDKALQGLALYEISLLYVDQGKLHQAQEHIQRFATLGGANPASYVRWRGHAWSAFFPACLRLSIGSDAPGGPPP